MDKIRFNIFFKEYDNLTLIVEKGETKIGELIKQYFGKIKKSNLMVNNVNNIYFTYNTKSINSNDYGKTILEYFESSPVITITVLNKFENYDYEIIEPISETQFTSIYKAKLLNTNTFVAVKKIFLKIKLKKK